MSYQVKRYLGYEPWGIVNPWVFANFGQPQRGRGYVSPLAYKGHPPRMGNHHLGQTASDDASRAVRMERYTIAGLAMGAASLGLYTYIIVSGKLKRNKRTRRRTR